MNRSLNALVGIGLMMVSTLLTASQSEAGLSAIDIIEKAEQAAYYAGDNGRSKARMMIVDSQGRKQMRQFTIFRHDRTDASGLESGDQDMLVFFSRPSEVKGMVFRVEKYSDLNTDDNRWLYLPALDLVKRIAAGDKRTSFVGSHFFYEDVSGRSAEEDTFTIVEETPTHYVLKAVPKYAQTVEFAYYIVSIDKRTFIPTTIDFFNENDANYRRVEALAVEAIQGFHTVVRSKVSDLVTGGYTLMEFRGVEYNLTLSSDLFTERSLRVPPRALLN